MIGRRWLCPPGMVRVSKSELLQGLRSALRAGELEVEVAARRRERDELVAGHRARDLIEERVPLAEALLVDEALVKDLLEGLLNDLPLTVAGDLHEPAFLLVLDQVIWDYRLDDVVSPARAGRTDQ